MTCLSTSLEQEKRLLKRGELAQAHFLFIYLSSSSLELSSLAHDLSSSSLGHYLIELNLLLNLLPPTAL